MGAYRGCRPDDGRGWEGSGSGSSAEAEAGVGVGAGAGGERRGRGRGPEPAPGSGASTVARRGLRRRDEGRESVGIWGKRGGMKRGVGILGVKWA